MSSYVPCKVVTPTVTNSNVAETSEDINKIFGLWVRANRRKQDLTQQSLARLVGIDRQQIYRIESGQSGTKRDTIIALAKALNVDTDVALDKAGYVLSEPINKPKSLAELIDRLEALGVENIIFADNDAMAHGTPDDLQAALDAVKLALEITINRKKRPNAPTNDGNFIRPE